MQKPDIYKYTSYVLFMNDWYEFKKYSQSGFSLRLFSNLAGYKSKSYISEILSEKKELSRKKVLALAEAMSLNTSETEHFKNLVYFKTSKCEKEKKEFWDAALRKRQPALKTRRSYKEFKIIEQWYTLPIREIITVVDFKEDYSVLGKLLVPPISQKQAYDSVQLLLELGMVEKRGNLYEQTSFELFMEPELKKLAGHSFQKNVLSLGIKSLDNLKKNRRNTQTITFGSNKRLNERLNSLIENFVEDVYRAAQEFPEVEEVKQLNLQIFSLTKPLVDIDEDSQ